MTKKIRRLDESVSSRIAAGEVIENPASVVKELIENALDAGSGAVTVSLRQGGKGRIVVEDDGQGIPFDELPLAVERFATSKITDACDLEAIATLGYRGEALASLGAVSRLEIRSLAGGEQKGGLIRCTGGIVEAHLRVSTGNGTRVQVDDLFFNLPARRKFLKQAASETRKAGRLLRDYSVAYPEVQFALISDGKTVFSSGNGMDRERLLQKQWGHEPAVLTRRSRPGDVIVEAWWQPRSVGNRLTLTTFVNGRRVTDPAVRAALSSFGPRAAGLWFLLIEVPSGSVDVNIHPAKAEVRFKNSGEIFQAVAGTAETMMAASEGSVRAGSLTAASPGFPPSAVRVPEKGRGRSFPDEALFTRVSAPPSEPVAAIADGMQEPGPGDVRYLGMLESGYLFFGSGGSLVIVDPHAAHERILYEEALARMDVDKGKSQRLSVPVALPPTLAAAAEEYQQMLQVRGFALVQDEGQCRVEAVPAVSGDLSLNPVEMIRAATEVLEDSGGTEREHKLQARWALLACKRAVKLGEAFSFEEALRLWRDLSRCRRSGSCPHGRPTMIALDAARLGRLFGRE